MQPTLHLIVSISLLFGFLTGCEFESIKSTNKDGSVPPLETPSTSQTPPRPSSPVAPRRTPSPVTPIPTRTPTVVTTPTPSPSGLPAPISPTLREDLVPRRSLALWLRSDQGVTCQGGTCRDGSSVTTWSDQSSSRNSAIQNSLGNLPTFRTRSETGSPSLVFTGSHSLGGQTVLRNGSTGFSIAAVWKSTQNTPQAIWAQESYQYPIAQSYDQRASILLTGSSVFGFSGQDNDFYPAPFTLNRWMTSTLTVNTLSSLPRIKVWSNGDTQNPYSGSLPYPLDFSSSNPIYILGSTRHGNRLMGEISEILVYTCTLAPFEVENLRTYLKTKYSTY